MLSKLDIKGAINGNTDEIGIENDGKVKVKMGAKGGTSPFIPKVFNLSLCLYACLSLCLVVHSPLFSICFMDKFPLFY